MEYLFLVHVENIIYVNHVKIYLCLKSWRNKHERRLIAVGKEEILYRKKVNKILLISKEIAHKLNKEFGVPFGENGISSTGKLNGRHKYYLCESRKNLSLLKKLEK